MPTFTLSAPKRLRKEDNISTQETNLQEPIIESCEEITTEINECTSSLSIPHSISSTPTETISTCETLTQAESTLSTTIDISDDTVQKLAEKIGCILLEQKEKKCNTEDKNFQDMLSTLTDNGTELICMPCMKYSHSNKVPEKLKKLSVGNFELLAD